MNTTEETRTNDGDAEAEQEEKSGSNITEKADIDIVPYKPADGKYGHVRYFIDEKNRSHYRIGQEFATRGDYLRGCEQHDIDPVPDSRDASLVALTESDEWILVPGMKSDIKAPAGTQLVLVLGDRGQETEYYIHREEVRPEDIEEYRDDLEDVAEVVEPGANSTFDAW